MLEKPVFLQGWFNFSGTGLDEPAALNPAVTYKVPFDKRAQLVYFRAGNPIDELIYVVLTRDRKAMRYFPIGAKGASHVELAVVEDLQPETVLEVLLAAPAGVTDSVVLDLGLVEIET